MSAAQHQALAGPWTVVRDEVLKQQYVASAVAGENMTAICLMLTRGEPSVRQVQAIAALPRLIVALRDCVTVMEQDLGGLRAIQSELRQAKAALALLEPHL